MRNKKFFEEVKPKRRAVEPYDQDYVLINKRNLVAAIMAFSYAFECFRLEIKLADDLTEKKLCLELADLAREYASELSPAEVDKFLKKTQFFQEPINNTND